MPFVNKPAGDDAPTDDPPASLTASDPSERRRAALAMREVTDVPTLAAALEDESDRTVQLAVLDSLRTIGSPETADVLVPLLASEDITLRTGAVEALQSLGDASAPAIQAAIKDPDPDVRIMALDVLQDLRCADSVNWLSDVLANETHANVVGTALDRLVEIGTAEQADLIRDLPGRFPEDPFIAFAASQALKALEQDPAA